MTKGMFDPLDETEKAKAQKSKRQQAIKEPIIPVPVDAPDCHFKHPQHGESSNLWAYRDTDGGLIGYVARFDHEGEKTYLPLTFCKLDKGKTGWRSKGFPDPKPLYHLPEILARSNAAILVCEGEKTAEAAQILFPDLVTTTPPHGAKSPQKADWTPVAGRKVIISTDNDEAGADFGQQVRGVALEAGAKEVLHLAPDLLGRFVINEGKREQRKGAVPSKWDLADALAEGWTADLVAEMQEAVSLFEPFEEPESERDRARLLEAWPFRVTERGVYKRYESTDKETGKISQSWRRICSTLEVIADTRNADGADWGRLLRLTDRDGNQKEWAMPMSLLAGDGTTYREQLWSLGLTISPGRNANSALHEYIATAKPEKKARCVSRMGWQGSRFIDPETTYPDDASERYLIQTTTPLGGSFRASGTLKEWQDGIARYAVGNSRLVLALSIAFAGPLLYPTGSESGGFHFKGQSSSGKTTALAVAGSVWGGGGVNGFFRTWRTTANGIEGVASAHCDSILLLDEIAQVDGREAGQIAYMLANGVGKARANRHGDARTPSEWRLLFLSTGEIGLAEKIAEDGKHRRIAAGQEVRIVDIPADAGAGHGLFEDLHDFGSAPEFAQHMRLACNETFGTARKAFLENLTKAFTEIAPTIRDYQKGFVRDHCPKDADGQVMRVANRFGLVAAAGELARMFGILPWPDHEATRAAAKCFADWMDARGGIDAAEDRDALEVVRHFIEAHGTSRFEPIGEPMDVRILNRAGYWRRDLHGSMEYCILPQVWKREVCDGRDAGFVAKVLADRGLLQKPNGKGYQIQLRLPGFESPVRCYCIRAAILGDGVAPKRSAMDLV